MENTFEAGAFLIDKPAGVSSFTVVRWVRKALRIKKVGHAGTLDPFATGLLVVCAGRKATRMIDRLMVGDKEYIATLKLGQESTTQDPEGEIVDVAAVDNLTAAQIEECLIGFVGPQLQSPPSFSACKHKGKPLYYYARKGIHIEKPPRPIHIHEIEWLDRRAVVSGEQTEISIRVVCSKGTYIRTLGADIGKLLGCGAYLTALRRTASGPFSIENSIEGKSLQGDGGRELLLADMISVLELDNLLQ